MLGSTVVVAQVKKRAAKRSLKTDAMALLLLQADADAASVRTAQKLVRGREYAAAFETLAALREEPQVASVASAAIPSTDVQASSSSEVASGPLAATTGTGDGTADPGSTRPTPSMPSTPSMPRVPPSDAPVAPPPSTSRRQTMTLALLATAQADLKWRLGEREQACELYRQALPVLDDHQPAMKDLTAHVAAKIGVYLFDTGALEDGDAVTLLAKALDIKGDTWLLKTSGSMDLMRALRRVMAPPLGGWTIGNPSPASRRRPYDDPFLASTVDRLAGVKAVREWVFVPAVGADQPMRFVVAETKTLHAWVRSPSGVVTQVICDDKIQDATRCSYQGFRWVVVRDRRSSMRAMVGSPRYRLYCNGRSCEV